MMNTGNAITDALGHLEQAEFEEEKRIAMVKATLSLEQPVLESIKDLASRMDTRIDDLASKMEVSIKDLRSDMDARFEKMESRFDKLESKLLRIEVVVCSILLPVLYIGYRIAVSPT